MIYVAHPYTDDPVGNMAKVELKLKELQIRHPAETFISPLHTFSWQAEISTWEQIMTDCINLLKKCDKVYFCKGFEKSKGCIQELNFCGCAGIPFEVEE